VKLGFPLLRTNSLSASHKRRFSPSQIYDVLHELVLTSTAWPKDWTLHAGSKWHQILAKTVWYLDLQGPDYLWIYELRVFLGL